MHEGTICREILDIAIEAAEQNGLSRISRITVAVGAQSCVQEAQLKFYFSYAKKGTIAEGAELAVERDDSLKGWHSEYVKNIEGD